MLESFLDLGYLGVFFFSFLLNLIPFVSPSNIVISGAFESAFPSFHPFLVGMLVAIGASLAKTIHFIASFFAGTYLRRKKKKDVPSDVGRHRLGMLALFLAAASPIPDDPVVVSLGLIRFSPVRFFTAYLTGKATITVLGAYLGQNLGLTLMDYFGETSTIIVSALLTVALTIVIVKMEDLTRRLNLERWIERFQDLIRHKEDE